MPTYTFRDTDSGEIFDVQMSMSDFDKYKEQHPTHERHFDSCPAIVSGVSVRDKRDDGFKETMARIAEAHPGSELAQQYGTKTIKQSQTERAIKKWRSSQ